VFASNVIAKFIWQIQNTFNFILNNKQNLPNKFGNYIGKKTFTQSSVAKN